MSGCLHTFGHTVYQILLKLSCISCIPVVQFFNLLKLSLWFKLGIIQHQWNLERSVSTSRSTVFWFHSPLLQILSATWTSPSLTWNWTVFLTWPTSPPSGTQWRCSSRRASERSRRKSLRAPCYDAAEFNETQHHRCTTTTHTHTHLVTFLLFSLSSGSHPHTSPVLDPEADEKKKKTRQEKEISQKSHTTIDQTQSDILRLAGNIFFFFFFNLKVLCFFLPYLIHLQYCL